MFVRDEISNEIISGDILALVNYLPYGKSDDRNIGYGADDTNIAKNDPFSLAILGVKKMAESDLQPRQKKQSNNAVSLFLYMFSKLVINHELALLSVIPSSTKDNAEHGISRFCELLSEQTGIFFDRNTLRRTESIPKAATGGERDANRNAETLEVVGDLSGKMVLLVDDVTTSGCSRFSAKKKLQEAGANLIFFLALGQTLNHEYYSDRQPSYTLIARHWDLFFGLIIEPKENHQEKQKIIQDADKNRAMLFYKKESDVDDSMDSLDLSHS